jgi:hypothetical protein
MKVGHDILDPFIYFKSKRIVLILNSRAMRPFISKFSLRGRACSRLLSPSRPFSFSSISPKYLSEITNLPKLAGETPDVITEIWRTFHGQSTSAHGDVIADSAPAQDLLSKKKKCPMFIVPVFKSKDSYLILFTQFQDKYIIATYLEEYRTNPTGASPWLAVNFYDDLWKDKGLSLLRCDFLPNVTKEVGYLIYTLVIAIVKHLISIMYFSLYPLLSIANFILHLQL